MHFHFLKIFYAKSINIIYKCFFNNIKWNFKQFSKTINSAEGEKYCYIK